MGQTHTLLYLVMFAVYNGYIAIPGNEYILSNDL